MASEDVAELKETLKQRKQVAVVAGDAQEAKQFWCYETVLEIQELYAEAFQQLKQQHYYEGWCTLEQVELALGRLMPHFTEGIDDFVIVHIANHTTQLQGLFPYKIFSSPEIVHKRERCSICGEMTTLRRPCGHLVGEIYSGEFCYRIVEDIEFVGMAFTENPAMKANVVFLTDPQTGNKRDQFDYFVVEYLMKRLANPYDAWTVEFGTKLHTHSEYGRIGRNDPCPCGSKRKYKKCCLAEGGITTPHWQFGFTVPPDDLEDRLIIRHSHESRPRQRSAMHSTSSEHEDRRVVSKVMDHGYMRSK